MRKAFFTLLAVTLLLSFTTLSYCEMVVSLKQNPDADSPQIKVDIQLNGGQGVAGYTGFIVFDATVLKYVSATWGNYLESDGIFIRPLLSEDGTYTLALDVGGTAKRGTTVALHEGPDNELQLMEFFFEIPSDLLPDIWSEIPQARPVLSRPGAEFWGITVAGSAPLGADGIPVATDGDGTLATLTFEVIDPEKPAFILLPGLELVDARDTSLPETLREVMITATFATEKETRHTDVNGDGEVNILDLTSVATAFGQPVTDDNRSADVNADGEINILDLVEVANDFGKSAATSESFDNPEVSSPGPMMPASDPTEFVVGLVLPASGHLAATGEIMKSGFDLAFDQINSTPAHNIRLRYILADDRGTAEGAVEAFEELIHKQDVSVILGPGSSSSTRAAFPIAQENGVVAISATAGAQGLGAIGDFVFRIAQSTDVVIPKGVKTTQRKLGYQKVATLYDKTDLFSTDRDAALKQAFSENDIEVLSTQTYATGDTDFTEQLTQIKALNPDALFVSALPPEKPKILIQARELGISVPIIISSLTKAEVEAAGDAAEGAITFTGWLATSETPGNRDFVALYQKTYGTEPNAFAAVSYACVHVFAEALKNAPDTDAQSIRDALAKISELDTILGKFSFDTNGDAVYEPTVLIVRNGTLQFF